jgi:hypothetical protein
MFLGLLPTSRLCQGVENLLRQRLRPLQQPLSMSVCASSSGVPLSFNVRLLTRFFKRLPNLSTQLQKVLLHSLRTATTRLAFVGK